MGGYDITICHTLFTLASVFCVFPIFRVIVGAVVLVLGVWVKGSHLFCSLFRWTSLGRCIILVLPRRAGGCPGGSALRAALGLGAG